MSQPFPQTLGELKKSPFHRLHGSGRSVKEEMRANLQELLRGKEALFPGIVGYDETVLPQLVNAILSKHNMILLGLRGQAKSRILRSLARFLDEWIPAVAGCEIHDSPYAPICRACRQRAAELGDGLPIRFLHREDRYVEKLATPDVTIADMIGDVDPIRAAKAGLDLSDELTIHYGLLPRANRGIFAVNELPDLAGKIQVGLFNILQEGDVQIKGYPVRLPLDLVIVFSANPEDYTARGKIITPLKDRIGSEIRTHYPATIEDGMAITQQEAWLSREGDIATSIPVFVAEVVEAVAFAARKDPRVDKRSGVSQRLPITCLENTLSNAERRALRHREKSVVPRIGDVYAALPSLTGKFELEYEGELRGADNVARDLIRAAVGEVFGRYSDGDDYRRIIDWFELGGSLRVPSEASTAECMEQFRGIQGLVEKADALLGSGRHPADQRVAAAEFILEGLYAQKKISRSEDRLFAAAEKKQRESYFDDVGETRKKWN
ncbi:MAG: magnesium chelatase [Acidobacteria bacterium]|nr:MAG: magnesium chelatase [Acidobacteriota bacterium]